MGETGAAEGAEREEPYAVVWCRGCGLRMKVEVRGFRQVKRWCSPACRTRATRRERVLLIGSALEGTRAERLAALDVMGPELGRARGEAAIRTERVLQQGGDADD